MKCFEPVTRSLMNFELKGMSGLWLWPLVFNLHGFAGKVPNEKFVNARRWFNHIQHLEASKLPEAEEKVRVAGSAPEPLKNAYEVKRRLYEFFSLFLSDLSWKMLLLFSGFSATKLYGLLLVKASKREFLIYKNGDWLNLSIFQSLVTTSVLGCSFWVPFLSFRLRLVYMHLIDDPLGSSLAIPAWL